MNRIKRTILSIILVIFLLPLSSCVFFRTTDATMDELVGIYKLTTYTKKDLEQNEYDNIEKMDMEAYLLVTGEEVGYYYYKDKNTLPYVRAVDLIYYEETDEEKISSSSKTLYKSVRYYTRIDRYYTYLGGPGSDLGEEQMGINNKVHTLSYTVSYHEYYQLFSDKLAYIQEYQDVIYTKVSDKKTFEDFVSFLELEGDLAIKPIDPCYIYLNNYLTADPAISFAYFHKDILLKLDFDNKKVKFYYTDDPDTLEKRNYHLLETLDYTEINKTYPSGEEVKCIKIDNSFLGNSLTFPIKYIDGVAPTVLYTDSLLTPELTHNYIFYNVFDSSHIVIV